VPTQCNSVGGITERGGERARRKKSNKIIIIIIIIKNKLNEPNTDIPIIIITADGDPQD